MSMDLTQQGLNNHNLALGYNLYYVHYKTLEVKIDVETYDIN